jgi:hypothetical protein
MMLLPQKIIKEKEKILKNQEERRTQKAKDKLNKKQKD